MNRLPTLLYEQAEESRHEGREMRVGETRPERAGAEVEVPKMDEAEGGETRSESRGEMSGETRTLGFGSWTRRLGRRGDPLRRRRILVEPRLPL